MIVGRYGTAIMSAVIGLVPAFGLFAAPSSTLAAIVLGAIAIVGALHGLGRVVGRLAGDDDAPVALVLAWGLAAWIGIAGILIAAGGSKSAWMARTPWIPSPGRLVPRSERAACGSTWTRTPSALRCAWPCPST